MEAGAGDGMGHMAARLFLWWTSASRVVLSGPHTALGQRGAAEGLCRAGCHTEWSLRVSPECSSVRGLKSHPGLGALGARCESCPGSAQHPRKGDWCISRKPRHSKANRGGEAPEGRWLVTAAKRRPRGDAPGMWHTFPGTAEGGHKSGGRAEEPGALGHRAVPGCPGRGPR